MKLNKMNKKGGVFVSLLIFLIIVVLTSSVILILVKTEVINVKDGESQQKILNTEFIPFDRAGSLVLRDLLFCDFVDEDLYCDQEKESFAEGERVYLWFAVESSVSGNVISLKRNYRVKDPRGFTIFEADQKNSHQFSGSSMMESEVVVFADYFTLSEEALAGEYSVDFIIENPQLNKKIITTKMFELIK